MVTNDEVITVILASRSRPAIGQGTRAPQRIGPEIAYVIRRICFVRDR